MKLRDKLRDNHPVVGDNYRLLGDNEVLEGGDQTACISLLLSLEHHRTWVYIRKEDVGQTVSENLIGDSDAAERVYRRRQL